MSIETLGVALNTVISAGLVWTCFCRLVLTNHETYLSVRLGLYALALASLASAAAPFWLDYQPEWPHLALSAGMLATQGTMARFWAHGVPCQFQRSP